MPTVIARSEYPDIIEIPSSFDESNVPESTENIAIRWDVILAASDTFQVRLLLNDEDVVWTKNINIQWVFSDYTLGWARSTAFTVHGQTFDAGDFLPPTSDDLKFIMRVYAYSNFEECQECGFLVNFCDEYHVECSHCEEQTPHRNSTEHYLNGDYYASSVEVTICGACHDAGIDVSDVQEFANCYDCCEDFVIDAIDLMRTAGYDNPRWICTTCRDDGYYSCTDCGLLVSVDDYYSDDYDDIYCYECWNGTVNRVGDLYEWNYRPELVFHPSIPVDPLKPLYIGMELEVQWTAGADWIERAHDEYGDLLYCKSDSSVEGGFEVVTHPMSPAWALENFPFDFFQEAIMEGAAPKHVSCGTHIHIDKASLTTAQVWKLLQVHMRLSEFCGHVGGRGTQASYARFDERNNRAIVQNMLKIARDKGEAFGAAERYVAVNVQNEQTLELRYMEGSIHPHDIRKNIEWVQALYEFTDTISVADIKGGALHDPGYLLGFIAEGNYPNLMKHLSSHYVFPKSLTKELVCV